MGCALVTIVMQARFRVRYGLCAVGFCTLLALFPGCAHRSQQIKESELTGKAAQIDPENADDWEGSATEKRANSYAHYATGLIYEHNQQPERLMMSMLLPPRRIRQTKL